MIQKIFLKMYSISSINTHYDFTNFEVDGIVQNT